MSGVLDARIQEVIPDVLREASQHAHEPFHVRPQFRRALRQVLRVDRPLQVVVEILVGVQLGGVPRQPEQLDPVRMLLGPGRDRLGIVRRQAIEDQKGKPGVSSGKTWCQFSFSLGKTWCQFSFSLRPRSDR